MGSAFVVRKADFEFAKRLVGIFPGALRVVICRCSKFALMAFSATCSELALVQLLLVILTSRWVVSGCPRFVHVERDVRRRDLYREFAAGWTIADPGFDRVTCGVVFLTIARIHAP